MELTPRLRLMNWLVSQGLTGLPENDLIRGFCERCCVEGPPVSRGMVFIDTLHPIFEGRGFRWNDAETNESDVFEYGSTNEGEAAQAWRSSIFYHMLENGHEELPIELASDASYNFKFTSDLVEKGHKHLVAYVHQFGEAGTMGQMDCVYSYWGTRRDDGFGAQGLAALRAKPIVAPGPPIGIDAVHLPHGAGLAELVHIGHQMLVTLLDEIAGEFEIVGCVTGELDRQFLMAVFEHVIEDRTAPGLRGLALVGRAIFEDVALVGLGVVPAKAAALENRVQRIDEDHPARHGQAFGAAALAEAADQVIFGQTCEALADQPVHQAQTGREFHTAIMP